MPCAGAARGGLWGNHGYEGSYLMPDVDGDGATLIGAHAYALRLSPTLSVRAFWSLTMYDFPNYYLVNNPTARYSIGDRTRGIVYDDDGGLTITMSATRPTDEKAAANWLSAPNGKFRLILRMYAPGSALFDGRYQAPAIERVD